MEASLSCTWWKFSSSYVTPCLNQDAYSALKSMSSPPSNREMMKFFETFGTHALTDVYVGAEWRKSVEYEKSTKKVLEKKGIKLGYKTSASYFGFSGGSSANISNASSKETLRKSVFSN